MSDAISPLQGATFEGFATIRETGVRGMITLRGDLGDDRLQKSVSKLTGVSIPKVGQALFKGDNGLIWMSPDEILILCPYDKVAAHLANLSKALKAMHHLATNVSDARAVFQISGAGARDVLAKLTPADMSPEAFGPGQVRRTRAAQVAAAIWLLDDDVFELVCFRSVADYVFGLLKASAQPGSEVGMFQNT